MSKANPSFFSRLLSSSRLGMLASTMFGVIAGIYLTNFFEKRQLYQDRDEAMERVQKEIKENQEDLQTYYDLLKDKHQALNYLNPWLDREEELIVIPKDSLAGFKEHTKEIFTIGATESYGNHQLKISGEMDLSFNSDSPILFTGLSNIVWEAYKAKNFLQVTDFNCMTNLENLYKLQTDLNAENKEWFAVFMNRAFLMESSTTERFLLMWENLLLKQKVLLQYYEMGDEKLFENCK